MKEHEKKQQKNIMESIKKKKKKKKDYIKAEQKKKKNFFFTKAQGRENAEILKIEINARSVEKKIRSNGKETLRIMNFNDKNRAINNDK